MNPLLIAAWAVGISTGVQVIAQRQQAKAQEIELEKQAEQEKFAAESRELRRRQQLNKVLAANVVSQASSGISGEGTPASIALESAKQVAISEGVEALSDRLRQAQLARQAKNIRGATGIQAASTLLSGTSKVAGILGSQ